MNAVAQLLKIAAEPPADGPTCDESDLVISQEDVATMSAVAASTDAALAQLLQKSRQFEQDISKLGSEMSQLQRQSSGLRGRLTAREQALTLLDPLLKQLTPPYHIVKNICEGPINELWFDNINELVGLQMPTAEGRAAEDALRLRRALVARALERSKLFYVHQFKVLRKPGTNAQNVQLKLLESKPAMDFVRAELPRLAAALCTAYRNTIKWYYTLLFGKYGRWLQRQSLVAPDHVRLLGTAIATQHGLLGIGHTSVKYLESFSVGMRLAVLGSPNPDSRSDGLLQLHTFQSASGVTYPIEQLARSMLGALSNSFEMESEVSKKTMISDTSFVEVFRPTLDFYTEILEKWIQTAKNDLFGLLITVRLLHESRIDQWAPQFVETLVQKCWNHIVHICTVQSESIEHASLKSSVKDASGLGDAGPHPLTQMFSSLLSGILQLATDNPEIELETSVRTLCEAYELFISKLAAGNESVLYNNYFVMLALLSDINVPLASDLTKHFNLLVKAYHP